MREQRGVDDVVVTVNDVGPVNDRDVQAGVLDRVSLEPVDLLRPRLRRVRVVALARHVPAAGQDRPDVVLGQHVVRTALLERPWRVAAAIAVQLADLDLDHLPDLLGQVHPVDEVRGAGLRGCCGVLVQRAGGRGCGDGCDSDSGRGEGGGCGCYGQPPAGSRSGH
jgi:hypothetical protein